jgi:hypothetical protein
LGQDRFSYYLSKKPHAHLNGAGIADGTSMALPGGATIQVRQSDGCLITWPDGDTLQVRGHGSYLDLALNVSTLAGREFAGLFGDGDGHTMNDLTPRGGMPIPLPPTPTQVTQQFADSWRITDAESLFDYDAGENTAFFTDSAFPSKHMTIDQLPPDQHAMADAACAAAGISNPALRDACVLDVGVTGDPSLAQPQPLAPGCEAGAGISRIRLQFDSTDPERVTSLTWSDSTSTMTGNLVAESGGSGCNGPTEFFGQAYGSPEFTTFAAGFGAGHLASVDQCGLATTITAAATDCSKSPQLPMTTSYQLYGDARASEVRIARTFNMDANTPVGSGTGLRPYVPRLHAGAFTTVIYPNQAGTAVASADDGACGTDCITSIGASWNGRWFADIAPSNGYAMIVLRDPAMMSPVNLAINNDAGSGSNLSSFVLIQPTGGWKAPVTEIEYLCFEDLTSWPQAQRDAAQLPAGCGP